MKIYRAALPRIHRAGLGLLVAALAWTPVVTEGQAFLDATVAVGLGEYIAIPADGHGPGAVFADLNGDGYPDLYLIGQDPVSSSGLFNAVYVNRQRDDGGRRFQKIPADDSGAAMTYLANGAVAGDYDNDGDLDLYVITYGANILFKNQWAETGILRFTDVTAATDPTPETDDDQLGVARAQGSDCDGTQKAFDRSLTAAWADVDRDGDLDLYVGTHNGFAPSLDADGKFSFDPERPPAQTSDAKPGSRDTFYRNNGDGTFTDATLTVTPTVGLTGFETADGEIETAFQCYASSNAALFADLNLDLWPDLLVSNKTVTPDDRDMLYLNQGADEDGNWLGFETVSYTLTASCFGEPRCFGSMSPAAMGIDVGDPDNDGDFDVYITDIEGNPAVFPYPYDLQLFNDLWVSELTQNGELSFFYDPSLPLRTSWGAQWQDFDNDGDEDLHVASSFADGFYVNPGGGSLAFSEEAEAYDIASPSGARGDVSADYNRDGWVDVLVLNTNRYETTSSSAIPSLLWENNLRQRHPEHHHLSLRLVGDPTADLGPWRSTRDAIGARVRVHADLDGDGTVGPHESQMREVRSGSSNAASTSSLELEFGLAHARQARVEIFWPSGQRSLFEVRANRHLRLFERGDVRRLWVQTKKP
jgi:hypothetical protein